MIKSFKHKGLQAFFETGSKAGIQPHHAIKLRVLLTALNNAEHPNDMNAPNWNMHPLKGELAEHYAVTVNGNWRITFTFKGNNTELIDYLDYH